MKLTTKVFSDYPAIDEQLADKLLAEELSKNNRKIVVLDDDPTGVQTVHDISVFTGWDADSIRQGFEGEHGQTCRDSRDRFRHIHLIHILYQG